MSREKSNALCRVRYLGQSAITWAECDSSFIVDFDTLVVANCKVWAEFGSLGKSSMRYLGGMRCLR